MNLLRKYIRQILLEGRYEAETTQTSRNAVSKIKDLVAKAWLQEKAQRGKGKNKRILYHINKRPAMPQAKMKHLQDWDPKAIDPDTGERTGDMVDVPGTDNWQRYWLDSPVKSGVFLTPNPIDIAMNHGRSGHVYAYKVPQWVIAKSGGLHRYDSGSEVLVPEDVWNEAGKEIEFMGKSMDKKELWDEMMPSLYGRGHQRPATKPSWMSDKELEQWQARQDKFNLEGLRSTKHPEDVIKLLTAEEQQKAIEAIEAKKEDSPGFIEKGPRDKRGIVIPSFGQQLDKKDEELLALLKKHMNESSIRECIRELLAEGAKTVTDLPAVVHIVIDNQANAKGTKIYYAEEDGKPIVRNEANWFPRGEMYIEDLAGREGPHAPCGGAWVISSVNAGHGWGPMLYDVAMEYATIRGEGLIADRYSVSPAARNVWDYYMNKRPDVTAHQLDDLKDTLTPEREDNCHQRVATYDTTGGVPKNVDWVKSSLSKRYTAPPKTIGALSAAGKLVELES